MTFTPYTQSETHHRTVAALHTPKGQSITDARAMHDRYCNMCSAERLRQQRATEARDYAGLR